MINLRENLLDSPKNEENAVFIINHSMNKVMIRRKALKNLVYPVLNAIEQMSFDPYIIKKMAVIGSAITPLSDDATSCDIVVGVSATDLAYQMPSVLKDKSGEFYKAVAGKSQTYSKIKYNQSLTDDESLYFIRKLISETLNGRKIFDSDEMRVHYYVDDISKIENILIKQNHFVIFDNGKIVAKHVSVKNWGYVNFAKTISPRQYYSDIVSELFKLHQMFKRILTDLMQDAKLSSDSRDIYEYFKNIVIKIKKNRFNEKFRHKWIDKDGRPITQDAAGRPLDLNGLYTYTNVLFSHINHELIDPGEVKYLKGFNKLFAMVERQHDFDPGEIKEQARKMIQEFGRFIPNSFLHKKVNLEKG